MSMAGTSPRHRAPLESLWTRVLDSTGQLETAVRRAALEGLPLEAPLGGFVAKVRRESARLTDADITSLQSAGLTEDEILELTLASALGAAMEILRTGLDALEGHDPDET